MPAIDRYQRPELYECLAAEYALGTLQGRARERFIRLMDERPYIRRAVEDWQLRMDPLGELTEPTAPPERVWHNIHREITEAPAPRVSWFRSTGAWGWAAFAAVLVLSLTLLLPTRQAPVTGPETVMPSYVAVLENEHQQPMIVAAASKAPMRMKVMMKDEPGMGPNEDWELWCVPKDGKKPVSMGVLARGKETVVTLTQHDWDMMEEGGVEALAISLEPRGGSPTGLPTGRIMYKGALMHLG